MDIGPGYHQSGDRLGAGELVDLMALSDEFRREHGAVSAESNSHAAARIVAAVRAAIAPMHRGAIDSLAPHIRHMAGYHIGWWDADGRPTESAAKALRPAFAVSSARAVGGAGTADRPSVHKVAVAVELLHDFTLVHDDVMDGDRLRRGRPTAWTVFGSGQAILVGDALLSLAHNLLANDPRCGAMTALLAEVSLELYAGQSADLAFEQRMDVSPTQCLEMMQGKTGALLGAACQLGAVAASADAATAGLYREFGRQLGLAFQLVDDLMDIWGPTELTGKPQGSDLRSRKKSFPVVAAITSETDAGKRLAELYCRPEPFTDADIEEAARLVAEAGGRAAARAEAEARARAALTALDKACPLDDGARDLRILARSILERNR